MFRTEVVGDEIIIMLSLESPKKSKTGKSMIIATTSGFQETNEVFNGRKILVSANVIIKK